MESDNFQYEREMKWDNAGEGVVRQIVLLLKNNTNLYSYEK